MVGRYVCGWRVCVVNVYIILLNNEHINAYIKTKGRGQSLMMQVVFSHC